MPVRLDKEEARRCSGAHVHRGNKGEKRNEEVAAEANRICIEFHTPTSSTRRSS
jgi:hypothetical protein